GRSHMDRLEPLSERSRPAIVPVGWRRRRLYFPAFSLLDQVIAAASAESHHRKRGVLITGRRKGVASEHVQVRNIVRLAKRIQDTVLGVGAHPRGSDFV